MPKDLLKSISLTLLLFSSSAFAAVGGKYSVSGLLSSPVVAPCYFSLDVQGTPTTLTLAGFSCGKLRFQGGNLRIEGTGHRTGEHLLRNASGTIVGNITDSQLQYQENDLTIRISMKSENNGFLQFSISPYVLTGNLTRTP